MTLDVYRGRKTTMQCNAMGRVMNIHIQNCSTWLINLHSRQNGGDAYISRQTRARYY